MSTDASILSQLEALLRVGRTAEALAVADREASGGNKDALFQIAVWRLIGTLVPRDLKIARRLLRKAAGAGHVDAAHMEIALIANGSGAPPDWPLARRRLNELAGRDPAAAHQLELLDAMALTPDGETARDTASRLLADQPRIHHYPGLLTEAECAHLAQVSAPILEPAVVVDPRTGRQVPHPIRTSDGAAIGPTREDLVVRAINLRIAAATGTDVAQGEALTILRYRPGQQYRLHLDTLPNVSNQRVRTVLVYLNGGFAGGGTTFPELGFTVTPRGGDAIAFDNVTAEGGPDPRARHAGLPVETGTKWLATRWIRALPFDVWRGP